MPNAVSQVVACLINLISQECRQAESGHLSPGLLDLLNYGRHFQQRNLGFGFNQSLSLPRNLSPSPTTTAPQLQLQFPLQLRLQRGLSLSPPTRCASDENENVH